MRKSFVLLFFCFFTKASFSSTNIRITVCYLPLTSIYHEGIGWETLLTHSKLKCEQNNKGSTCKDIDKTLSCLRLCTDTLYGNVPGDYRVYVKYKRRGITHEIFIQRNGLIRMANTIYFPNKQMELIIGKLINQEWTMTIPKEWL